MSKRRYNAKKIAQQPSLKRRMAEFCAQFDVQYGTNKDEMLLQILYKGHRGFISLSEDSLAKEFDKRIEMLRTKYGTMLQSENDRKKDKWYRESEEFTRLTIYYEQGVSIANEVFEEQFLK